LNNSSNSRIIITVDGYSSSGKSTLAKDIARMLHYAYIDSGAMYRAVTLFFLKNNYINKNILTGHKIQKLLNQITIEFKYNSELGKAETFLNGVNVEKEIRGMEVSNHVSEVSAIKEVRHKMVDLQRKAGKDKGIVMDGRDIGTIVFPEAEVKLFITADPKERAKRRYKELKEINPDIKLEDIIANIQKRDQLDQTRKESPLRKPDDAYVIDNSHLTREEQLEKALEYLTKK
jgi:cytidylate kinase